MLNFWNTFASVYDCLIKQIDQDYLKGALHSLQLALNVFVFYCELKRAIETKEYLATFEIHLLSG